jgi:hypothetical protein
MPVDQVLIPDMPQLYDAAVRALMHCEPSDEHPAASSGGPSSGPFHTTVSREGRLDRNGGLSAWLHALLNHLAACAARRQA